ncbi:MAG: FAD-dependent oxidoreductase [Adlercreutzia equolifaciens]
MKVVIVGGVAGGATAAARLRRLDEAAEIVVFERSGYISYANCGLPYYIGGTIADKSALTLQTPESFRARFNVDMRTRHEVEAVDAKRHVVTVRNLDTGEVFEEPTTSSSSRPGASPQPKLPGTGLDRLSPCAPSDTFAMKDFINAESPRSAVVCGGGFIGLEVAENLRELGLDVTIVQRPRHLMNPFDADMAALIHQEMRAHGVHLALGRSVEGFEERDGGIDVLVAGEEPLRADMVVLAIGVTPDTTLAETAGLETGIKGSIVVNDRMETGVEDIYAVGDAVQISHLVTGDDALISLAGPANKQGRIAADVICGRDSSFEGSQGSSVLKLFDMTIAATGLTESAAQRAGIACDKAVTSSPSHATYYPGASNMTVKTVFEPESGRILGAQIVGFEGADKRIDVLATAIRARMTAADLEELDLAYAPPYSSAKDPVNMAGFVIENIRAGLVAQHHWSDVARLQQEGAQLLDVRTEGEFARGHIEGAINIPLDELRGRTEELDPERTVYVNCHSGLRSYVACRMPTGHGLACSNLSGGYRFYALVHSDAAFDETPTHPCGTPIS